MWLNAGLGTILWALVQYSADDCTREKKTEWEGMHEWWRRTAWRCAHPSPVSSEDGLCQRHREENHTAAFSAGSQPTVHITDWQLPSVLPCWIKIWVRGSACFPLNRPLDHNTSTVTAVVLIWVFFYLYVLDSTPNLLSLASPHSPLVRNASVSSTRHGGRILKERMARRGWRGSVWERERESSVMMS